MKTIHKLLDYLIVIFILFSLFHVPLVFAAKPPAEYEVKVAFLLKFPVFIEWPDSAQIVGSSPLAIGIVGADPFGALLPADVSPEEPDFLSFKVTRITDKEEDLSKFQIIYIGGSDSNFAASVIEKIQNKPVLTVGEGKQFLSAGGIISFSLENNRVRFQINLKNAKKSNLKISSQLLNLANFTIK
ncbi:MAG: YfiR family protein [Candidatus Riflebacteria bacterium]|nr:YfiR family protein [Candidatus Riflebacteria bacterium]